MPYIYDAEGWPEFTWNNDVIAPVLARARFEQGLLSGQMTPLDAAARKEAEQATMLADLIGSSALEDLHLSRRDALKLLEAKSDSARAKAREAGGPALAASMYIYDDIRSNPSELLTAQRIQGWHGALCHGQEGNGWREESDGPKKIVYGALGWERVQFEAPSAKRVPQEMKNFLAWFNFGSITDAHGQQRPPASQLWQDGIIRAALAHFWFVTIHPFADGSGRIARAISDLALAQDPRGGKDFFSLNARMEAEKQDYYTALKTAQTDNMDVTPWLDWFLHCFIRAVSSAHESLEPILLRARLRARALGHSLSDRQIRMFEHMLAENTAKMTTSVYAELAGCSPDSALRDLQDMLKCGLIRQNPGGGRSTSYSLKK